MTDEQKAFLTDLQQRCGEIGLGVFHEEIGPALQSSGGAVPGVSESADPQRPRAVRAWVCGDSGERLHDVLVFPDGVWR